MVENIELVRALAEPCGGDIPLRGSGCCQLTRALAWETEIGEPITPKWFKPVAEILAAVYRLRKGAA